MTMPRPHRVATRRNRALPDSRHESDDYARFLAGKSVCIVGPGGYLQGQGRGPFIDSHDLVAILNWGQFKLDLQADYGSRVDIVYKRLLKLGKLDFIELDDYIDAGVRYIVAIDHASRSGPNAQSLMATVGDRLPIVFEGTVRQRLMQELRTSPLAGVIAIKHLLMHDVKSVYVTGCDFYASGYHEGYGGQVYRKSMGRREGTPGPTHDVRKHLNWLARLKAQDSRLQFDETLAKLVREAKETAKPLGRPSRVERIGGILGVIPARYQSSRFPGKPLALIAGKPMILWTCEAVAKALQEVVVATDDERIAEVVRGAGYRAIITPAAMTGTDRVAIVANEIKARFYINIQGDEPLVEPAAIKAMVRAKKEHANSVIGAVSALGEDPGRHVVKVAMHRDGKLAYASRAPIAGGAWRQLGLYAFNRNELIQYARHKRRGAIEDAEDVEILRFLEIGIPVHMADLRTPATQAVDRPEDIAAVEAILKEREK